MTHPDRNALAALIEAVEAETLSRSMCETFFPERHEHRDEDPAYHMMAAQLGSLDAASALHEALLPGCAVTITMDDEEAVVSIHYPHFAGAALRTPARAWLLAILRALAAEGGE